MVLDSWDSWKGLPNAEATLQVPLPSDTAPLFERLQKNSDTKLIEVDALVKDYNELSTKYAAARNAMSVRMGAYHYTIKSAGIIPKNVQMHQLVNKLVVVRPDIFIFENEDPYKPEKVTPSTVGQPEGGAITVPWTACIRSSFDPGNNPDPIGNTQVVRTDGDCTSIGSPAMITFANTLAGECNAQGASGCPDKYVKIGAFTGNIPTGLRQCYSLYRYLMQGTGNESPAVWGYNNNQASSQFMCPNIKDLFASQSMKELQYGGDPISNLDQAGIPQILGSTQHDERKDINYMSYNYGTVTQGDDVKFPDFKRDANGRPLVTQITLTPIDQMNLQKATPAGSDAITNAPVKDAMIEGKDWAVRSVDGNWLLEVPIPIDSSPRPIAGTPEPPKTYWLKAFVLIPNLMLVRSALNDENICIKLDGPNGTNLTNTACDYIYDWYGEAYAVILNSSNGKKIGDIITPNDFLPVNERDKVRLWMRIPGVESATATTANAKTCAPEMFPDSNTTSVFDVRRLHEQVHAAPSTLSFTQGRAVDSYTGEDACTELENIDNLTKIAQQTLIELGGVSKAIREKLRDLDDAGITSQLKPGGDETYRKKAQTYYELNKAVANAYQKLLNEQNELHVLDESIDDMRRHGVSDRYKMIFYLIILLMFMSSVYFIYQQSN